MKIKLQFDDEPNLPDFSESEFESVEIACDGQSPKSIADALFNVLEGYLNSVSFCEIVGEMAELLNRDEQQQVATDILGQWGSDIIDSIGKAAESEATNKDHGRP